MNIEAPAALWLALVLPAILLLWLLRPRRVRQRVPSLLLWRATDVQRRSARPWQRLRNHPLLWLQLLVAALLIAAALRPFLPAPGEAQHVVVLLDASGSMRATDIAPNRFAAARAQVDGLARSLGPGQRLTLVRLDEAPVVLASAARADEIERLLSSQEASYGAANLGAALALAEGVAPGPGEWLLVSDGVLDIPAGARLPEGVSLRTVLVGSGAPASNVAVTGLRVRVEEQGDGTTDQPCCVSLQASVLNTGREAVRGRLVIRAGRARLASEERRPVGSAGAAPGGSTGSADGLAGAEVLSAQEWTLEPGEERHLTWTGLPAGPGWFEAGLADVPAEANALPQDDRAWAGVPVPDERRVLLVSDGNIFLERAIAILGGVRADRVAPDAWTAVVASAGASGEPYDVVVFDGVWPDDPPSGNVLLLGHPTATAFAPERIQPAAAHPLLRHVDWSDVNIAAAARLPYLETWEVVVNSPNGPLLAVRESAGRREAALTFRLTHSDLALRPAFPVLLANLLDWLAPRPAGEPIVVIPGSVARVEPMPLAETIHVEEAARRAGSTARPGTDGSIEGAGKAGSSTAQAGTDGSSEVVARTGSTARPGNDGRLEVAGRAGSTARPGSGGSVERAGRAGNTARPGGDDSAGNGHSARGDQSAARVDTLAPPWPPAAFRAPAPGLYRVVQQGPAGKHERLIIASGYVASEAALTPRPVAIRGGEATGAEALPPRAWSLWPFLAIGIIAVSLLEWWVDARGR